MVDRFEKFTFNLTEISKYYNKIASDEMEKYGLKGPYAIYLAAIYRHPEGVTSAKLCEICCRDKAEVSRAVAFMEKKGLVIREEINNSSYRALIKLTDTGTEAAVHVCERIRMAVERGSEGISDEHRKLFYDALDIIARNLHKISEEGLPINRC